MRELRNIAGVSVLLDTDVDRFLGDTRQYVAGPGKPAGWAMWWDEVYRHESGACYLWVRSRFSDDDGDIVRISAATAVVWLTKRCGISHADACAAVGVDPADEAVLDALSWR